MGRKPTDDHSTFLRKIEMLRLIPRLPRKRSAPELRGLLEAAGYPIDLRTVQRDLDAISGSLPLGRDEGHRPAGWYWIPEAPSLDIPGMEVMAALTFHLAGTRLRNLLPPQSLDHLEPYFQEADRVLEREGKGHRDWPRKVAVRSRHLSLLAPAVPRPIVETVYRALFGNRRLQITYRRANGQTPADWTINPLGLVIADQVTYLVCTIGDYTDPLTLLLHRVKSAECTKEEAVTPRGFRFADYVASGGAFGWPPDPGAGATLELRLLFDKPAAFHLRETPLSRNQTLTGEGDRVAVTATVPDSPQLRWWLRGFGEAVEVIEPASLRRELAETARRMARRYASRKS